MKKRDLVKKLKAMEAKMLRQGKHEVWQSKNGSVFTVPRHNEINENTAQGILEQAKN